MVLKDQPKVLVQRKYSLNEMVEALMSLDVHSNQLKQLLVRNNYIFPMFGD